MGYVARMGEMRNAYKISVGKPDETGHSGELGVDGKVILKWFLQKQGEKVWTEFIWLRIRTSGGLL